MNKNEGQNKNGVVDKAKEVAAEAKEIAKDAKDVAKVGANVAAGNYVKAAIDGIKLAFRKLKDKKFRKKLRKIIIMKSMPIILTVVLILTLFCIFNAIKDKMVNLIGMAYSKATGFLAGAWKSITNDKWVDLSEKFEYVVDADTGENLGTPETVANKYTNADGKTVDINGNEYDESGNMLSKDGKVRNITTKEYTLVDQYVRELANNGVSIAGLKLLGEGDYEDKTVDELLEDEESKELIEKYIAEFIRADIITQQPHRNNTANLVNPNDQNKVDGGIYFYRNKRDPELKESDFIDGEYNEPEKEVDEKDYVRMSYITPEEFLKELGKDGASISELVTSGETIAISSKSKGEKLRYKYTINPETENLVLLEITATTTKKAEIANTWGWLQNVWEWFQNLASSETSYEVKLIEKDYKNMVSKYSMPYEFLINLCEITQNPEFVYHVALLARDTKIILAVQDDIDQKIEIIEKEKTIETWQNGSSNLFAGARLTSSEIKRERETTSTTTYTPSLKQYSADTWSFYEEYVYTKDISGTIDVGELITTEINYPEILAEYKEPDTKKEITGYDDTAHEVTITVPGTDYYYQVFDPAKTKSQTKTIVSSVKYNEPSLAFDAIEKSKQFLGLLRNDTGECEYDCANDVVSKRYSPTALKCAEEAEFNKTGKNVKYKLPNSTMEREPLGNLLDGLQMLYALLQSNSTGYNEKDKMYNSIEEKVDKEEESLSNSNYKDAYVIKMQGLVEHLQYLMTFPENEEYDPKTIEDSEVEGIITEDDENINYNVSQGTVASAREIYEYLISKGFTPESACGILGNIEQESGFYTSATNGTHFGLCQWGGERFAALSELATDRSKKWTDLQVQLDFLWSELEGKMSSVKTEIIGTTDMYHATEIFCKKYEICGGYSIEVPRRYKKAKKWYDILVLGKGLKDQQKDNASSVGEYTSGVNGKTYKIYRQQDYPNTRYWNGSISSKGCGVTTDCMVLSAYDINYTPPGLLDGRTKIGIDDELRKKGLSAERKKASSSEVANALNNKKTVIVHVDENSSYTSNEHWMALVDLRNEGKEAYVLNPNKYGPEGWNTIENIMKGCTEIIIVDK